MIFEISHHQAGVRGEKPNPLHSRLGQWREIGSGLPVAFGPAASGRFQQRIVDASVIGPLNRNREQRDPAANSASLPRPAPAGKSRRPFRHRHDYAPPAGIDRH